MRVAVAVDHAGFSIKDEIVRAVQDAGHEAIDLGAYSTEPVDFPDYALKLGQAILCGQAERGVLVCGSGIGASIAANKIKGIYAGQCHDVYSARQGVEHDNMNVMCLGARVIGPALIPDLIQAFLDAKFSTAERHHRRVAKIHNLEEKGTID